MSWDIENKESVFAWDTRHWLSQRIYQLSNRWKCDHKIMNMFSLSQLHWDIENVAGIFISATLSWWVILLTGQFGMSQRFWVNLGQLFISKWFGSNWASFVCLNTFGSGRVDLKCLDAFESIWVYLVSLNIFGSFWVSLVDFHMFVSIWYVSMLLGQFGMSQCFWANLVGVNTFRPI